MADPKPRSPASLPYRNFVAQTRSRALATRTRSLLHALLGRRGRAYRALRPARCCSRTNTRVCESRLRLDPATLPPHSRQARALGRYACESVPYRLGSCLGSSARGKSDVVFGTVLFGRMRSGAGADRVVGMFINTLPIRLHSTKLRRRGKRVQSHHRLLAELMVHEHAPLALAQRAARFPPPAPLFSSLFNYRYSAGRRWQRSRGRASNWSMPPNAPTIRWRWPWTIRESTFCSPSLASSRKPDAERVCRYLQQSMSQSGRSSGTCTRDCSWSTLQVVPGTERHMLLEEWNRTDANFEQGTLDGLFCRASPAHPRRPRGYRTRRQRAHLCGTRCPVHPPRPPTGRQRCAARTCRRRSHGTLGRNHHRAAWPFSKRAAFISRSTPPIQPIGSTTLPKTRRHAGSGFDSWTNRVKRNSRISLTQPSRLYHLHFGHHRPAQRRRGPALRARQSRFCPPRLP